MFGYSAKETLDIAQSLYERKPLTYPRTDSSYLTEEMEKSTENLIKALAGNGYFPFDILPGKPDIKRLLNNEKVSDHHALLPTVLAKTANLSELTEKEISILSIVVCRLFAAVSESELSTKTELTGECLGTSFTASGKNVVSKGWKELLEIFWAYRRVEKQEEDAKENCIPAFSQGEVISDLSVKVHEIKTSAPSHFSEDTLLAAMERAGNNDYDDETIEKKGLGAPATMAETIEGLMRRGFLERKKKQVLPSVQGENLIKLLPNSLTSPQMTAEWETKLQ